MNAHESKVAARVERMKARVERLSAASASQHAAARAIIDRVPLGQPILVGHHSERAHRRDFARVDSALTKALAFHKEAEVLRSRAERAEENTAVSSDDPDAIAKLREKLAAVEASRAHMVAANQAVRSKDPWAGLASLGCSARISEWLMTPNAMGELGFPAYELRNAASESSRLRKRIAELETRATRKAPAAVPFPGGHIEEADNRVRLVFDERPTEAMWVALKSAGFRWAPSAGAWQRRATNAAWCAARRITGVG